MVLSLTWNLSIQCVTNPCEDGLDVEHVNTAGKLKQQASDLKQLRKTASEREAAQRQQADAADALADQLAAV